MLGEEFLVRPRLSRIYYDGKYFAYPLQADGRRRAARHRRVARCAPLLPVDSRRRAQPRPEDVRGLGDDALRPAPVRRVLPLVHARRSGASRAPRSRPQWAAQRIKDFSLAKAILSDRSASAASDDDADRGVPLPAARAGPDVGGASRTASRSAGIPVQLNQPVRRRSSHRDDRVDTRRRSPSRTERSASTTSTAFCRASRSASSILSLDPPPPPAVTATRRERLRYRELVPGRADDDRGRAVPGQLDLPPRPGDARRPRPELRRLEPEHGRSPGTTCLGVEYFCFEGDEIWEMSSERRRRARDRASSRESA